MLPWERGRLHMHKETPAQPVCEIMGVRIAVTDMNRTLERIR